MSSTVLGMHRQEAVTPCLQHRHEAVTSNVVSGLAMRNTRQCECQNRTSVLHKLLQKLGCTPCFPGPSWAILYQRPLTFLLPKTDGHIAAAATRFLLPVQAESSACCSFLVEQRHAQERKPAKTVDTLDPPRSSHALISVSPSTVPAPLTSQRDSNSAVLWRENGGKNRSQGTGNGFKRMDVSI